MDTYSPDVTCPKCASDDLRVEWRPHEPERERDGRPGMHVGRPSPEDLVTVPARPERMAIDCRRCGYDWYMAPVRTSEVAFREGMQGPSLNAGNYSASEAASR